MRPSYDVAVVGLGGIGSAAAYHLARRGARGGAIAAEASSHVTAGCSGHAFKFASVLGEILADLALAGRTAHPIATFALDRFRRT